jgi:hypothetical protein
MEHHVVDLIPSRFLRGIERATAGQRLLQERNPEDDQDNKSFSIMLAALVGLILLFFVICIYQVFKIWFLDLIYSYRDNGVLNDASGDTRAVVLVHEGRAFNLTEHQRRAILETIFSSSSKVCLYKQEKNGIIMDFFWLWFAYRFVAPIRVCFRLSRNKIPCVKRR